VIAYASKSRPVKLVIANNNNVAPVIAPVFNNNIVNNVGHCAKAVEDVQTGQTWKMIKDLAEELSEEHNVPLSTVRTVLSKHLNGHTDHVYGRQYKAFAVHAVG